MSGQEGEAQVNGSSWFVYKTGDTDANKTHCTHHYPPLPFIMPFIWME